MAWNPVTLTGQVKDASNNFITATGKIWFELSIPGNSTTGGFAVGPGTPIVFGITAGTIDGAPTPNITANDDIVPVGTFYKETVMSSDGSRLVQRNVIINGPGTSKDIGTLSSPSLPSGTGFLITTPVDIPFGGTNATTAAAARTNLAVVGTARNLLATTPVRIDGGGTADLSADRTISLVTVPIGSGGTNNASAYTNKSVIFSDGSKLTESNTVLNFDSATSKLGVGAVAAVGVDTTGAFAARDVTAIAIANGANDNLAVVANTGHLRLTGGGASATLTGMAAGQNGQLIVVINNTGSAINVRHDNAGSTAANRLYVPGAADSSLPNVGALAFVYNTTLARWVGSGIASTTTVTAPITGGGGSPVGISITTTNDGGAVVKQAASPGTQQTSANMNISGNVVAGAVSLNTAAAPTEKIDMGTSLDVAKLDGLMGPIRYASTTTPSAINNTTTLTAFASTFSIPANYLRVGSVITVRASGQYGTTGTPTLDIQIRVGGASKFLLQSGPIVTASGASSWDWNAEAQGTVRVIGGSGSIIGSFGNAALAAGGSGTWVAPIEALNTRSGPGASATNGALVVDVAVQWGTASASNTISLLSLTVEIQHAYTNN